MMRLHPGRFQELLKQRNRHRHLIYAQAQGRVVVTEDADFAEIHFRLASHGGIDYFPGGRRSIGEIVERLRLLHAFSSAEEMVGRLEWLQVLGYSSQVERRR
jgi:hypothetical protein